jgi:hypothetical protein
MHVVGWPSRGEVIILERRWNPDFDFLSLDRLHPPEKRYDDPKDEDAFYQKMLFLGA